MNKRHKKQIAFTLAEVLITLGIIGIVAAITIPSLMNKTNDAELKTAYKKAFSEASNAWNSMYSAYEVIPCPDVTSVINDTCTYGNFDIFKTYMKISKDCDTGSVNNCWYVSGESMNEVLQAGSGEVSPSKIGGGSRAFIDVAGRSWAMVRGGFLNQLVILVDTNGFKNPNKFGKDRFAFAVANEKGSGTFWTGSSVFPGIPAKLKPSIDRTAVSIECGYPDCTPTSWLSK